MTSIGKVQNFERQFSHEWKIDNFFSLSERKYTSPSFSFAGESWHFTMYPNGRPERNSVEYIDVSLYRKLAGPPISLWCCLAVKTFEGEEVKEEQFSHVFKNVRGYSLPKFLKRSDLSEKKSELVPSDALTLVCHIDYDSKSSDDAGNTATAKCSYCKETLDADYVSCHEQKCLDKPIRCPTCGYVIELRKWFDHECDTARVKATETVLSDLADILESEEYSDVTIRVKDKEFRLHRNILASRNPYFSSMFKTEMKEKNTGIVSIDDCEPDTFHSFITFIYTGKPHMLSCDNVCALYEVADKYQQDQLKAECLCYMKNNISVDSFVDFIVLALKHGDKELLPVATDLFCRKTKEIILSIKWQTFLREYPTQSNELHIKALDYNANEWA